MVQIFEAAVERTNALSPSHWDSWIRSKGSQVLLRNLDCGICSFRPESCVQLGELLVDASAISSVLLTFSWVLKHFQAVEADT